MPDQGQNSFLDYIMNLRRRAGSIQQQGPGADDPISGPQPGVLEGLRQTMGNRMQQRPGMPMPMEVYMDMARRAGLEDEARQRAAAMFGGQQQGQMAPQGRRVLDPGGKATEVLDSLGTNRY